MENETPPTPPSLDRTELRQILLDHFKPLIEKALAPAMKKISSLGDAAETALVAALEKVDQLSNASLSDLPLGDQLSNRNSKIGILKDKVMVLESANKKLTDELEKVSIDCNDYRKELAVLLSKQPSMSTQPVPAAPEVKPIRVYGS